jgi:hypothetical protein
MPRKSYKKRNWLNKRESERRSLPMQLQSKKLLLKLEQLQKLKQRLRLMLLPRLLESRKRKRKKDFKGKQLKQP